MSPQFAARSYSATISASIASAGGYHCAGSECGEFVATRQWDGTKLCAACRRVLGEAQP